MSKLAQKLAEIMGEIDHVDKLGINEHFGYKYMKASDLAREVRGRLASKGISVGTEFSILRSYEIPAREGVMQACDVQVKMTLADVETGDCAIFVALGTGSDKGDKAVYKAMTGAIKYALRNAFLVPDESDPEADPKTDEATEYPGLKGTPTYDKRTSEIPAEWQPPSVAGTFQRKGYIADVTPKMTKGKPAEGGRKASPPKAYTMFRFCYDLADAAQRKGFSVSCWETGMAGSLKKWENENQVVEGTFEGKLSADKKQLFYNLIDLAIQRENVSELFPDALKDSSDEAIY